MIKTLLTILLATGSLNAAQPSDEAPDPSGEVTAPSTSEIESPGELLSALAEKDATISTLTGTIRYTIIHALESDRQTRYGKLAIRSDDLQHPGDSRKYAVSFNLLEIDDRQEKIEEHYIFDGRWFVERKPEEKQFYKRELVPAGQTLDPMELMRDAPFWVSLGRDQDRLLASYDAELRPRDDGLTNNPDYPELASLAEQPHVLHTTQLMLTPKPGSGFEDDWEWVRIWTDPSTLLPVLYIKADWSGDLQIVELFGVKANVEIPSSVFDTTSPDERSGWRVQISHWRGNAEQEPADMNP